MLEAVNRRSLITNLVSFIAAPAIVRASSIMPVKPLPALVPVLVTAPSLGEAVRTVTMELLIDTTTGAVHFPEAVIDHIRQTATIFREAR